VSEDPQTKARLRKIERDIATIRGDAAFFKGRMAGGGSSRVWRIIGIYWGSLIGLAVIMIAFIVLSHWIAKAP
jgi:tetrahydromethanopterin S-methyltransferase subunit G